jgi:aspartate aminotransferase-like enzyme
MSQGLGAHRGLTNRRDAIMACGKVAVRPPAARAQTSGKTYRIGFLGVFSYAEYRRQIDALLMGLRQLGYDEGKNIVISLSVG